MEWIVIIVLIIVFFMFKDYFFKADNNDLNTAEIELKKDKEQNQNELFSDEEIVKKFNKVVEILKNNFIDNEDYLDNKNFVKDNFFKYPEILTVDNLKPLLVRNENGDYETKYKDYNWEISTFLINHYIVNNDYKKIIELRNLNPEIYIRIQGKKLIAFIQYLLDTKNYQTALEFVDEKFYDLEHDFIIDVLGVIIYNTNVKKIDQILDIISRRLNKSEFKAVDILLSLNKVRLVSFLVKKQDYQDEYVLFYILIKSNEIIQNYDISIINENEKELDSMHSKKFNLFIRQLGKEGKNVNALYFLIKYGTLGQETSLNVWVINLTRFLLALEYYEIVKDFYSKFKLLQNNFDFLILLLPYCLENKDIVTAKSIIEFLEKVEPNHKVLIKAKKQLEKLEFKIENEQNGDKELDSLSGIEFEKLLCDKFKELGFFAEMTTGSGDFGADIIVETINQSKIIVQCKRFKNKVNLKAVQEVLGAVGHFNADVGIVITNNTFLNSAKKLAESNDVELWDENRLKLFLEDDISFSILKEL